jgi:hypothetical protein
VASIGDLIGQLRERGLLGQDSSPNSHVPPRRPPHWISSRDFPVEQIPPLLGLSPSRDDDERFPSLEESALNEGKAPRNSGAPVKGWPRGVYPTRDGGQDTVGGSRSAPNLGEIIGSPLGREVGQSGTDAIAWYIPYHSDPDHYGIYVRESGILLVADFIEAQMGALQIHATEAAFRFLNSHEETHNQVEVLLSMPELVSGYRIYLTRSPAAQVRINDPYYVIMPLDQVEEALSNAYAIHRRGTGPYRSLLQDFAQNHQPVGYRDYEVVRPNHHFISGLDSLQAVSVSVAGLRPMPSMPTFAWARSRAWEVPRYLVRDVPVGSGIVWAFRYGGVDISVHFANEHPPPHFHLEIPKMHVHGRYRYPGLEPALSKDPPLSNHARKMTLEAIHEYPQGKFEAEFDRHSRIVAG